jgi:hypothetical protein
MSGGTHPAAQEEIMSLADKVQFVAALVALIVWLSYTYHKNYQSKLNRIKSQCISPDAMQFEFLKSSPTLFYTGTEGFTSNDDDDNGIQYELSELPYAMISQAVAELKLAHELPYEDPMMEDSLFSRN